MTTHKGLTTISLRIETKKRIDDSKQVICGEGIRKRLENQDQVITRLLDQYSHDTH